IETLLDPTTQLLEEISHSYDVEIVQSWRRWKDLSKGFPNISSAAPKSS
ncbi:hypothetical protein MTR67_007912, partial [Solanum verrucosum]